MISALSRRLPGRLVPDFVAPAALAGLLSVGLVMSARAEKPTLLDAITKSGTLRVGLTAVSPSRSSKSPARSRASTSIWRTTSQSRLASSWKS
jgi:hypothetical protein